MKPRFTVHQQITPFVNKYTVIATDQAGNEGDPKAFVQQKRLAIKEKVLFYADEAHEQAAFTFRAKQVMEVAATYLVEDADGRLIGSFQKQFASSLLNSTWQVSDAEGAALFTVRESNNTLAILRRVGGMIPVVGDIIDMITMFLKYHFSFLDANGQEVGTYIKTTLLRDTYTFNMTDEAYDNTDWRLLAAMGVALDALQSR